MNIPEEAVEAAAKAAYIADNLGWDGAEAAWDDMGGSERSFERAGWEITARAALEAAYPAIRHMAAREALDGLIAKHDQSASRHPEGSSAHFDEQRATFRIMAYRDAEYPEAD